MQSPIRQILVAYAMSLCPGERCFARLRRGR